MNEQRTVWGVTGYDIGGNSGYVVYALFTTEAEALRYAEADDAYAVEEFTLYDKAPKPYTYWHRGAHVYPDGRVEDWRQEHTAQPPGQTAPVDDDLAPFDGHLQGHCGLHISIFGTDREAVEAAFQEQVVIARAQVNGTCQCGRSENYIRDFWDEQSRV